jgi:hypothetical protein
MFYFQALVPKHIKPLTEKHLLRYTTNGKSFNLIPSMLTFFNPFNFLLLPARFVKDHSLRAGNLLQKYSECEQHL